MLSFVPSIVGGCVIWTVWSLRATSDCGSGGHSSSTFTASASGRSDALLVCSSSGVSSAHMGGVVACRPVTGYRVSHVGACCKPLRRHAGGGRIVLPRANARRGGRYLLWLLVAGNGVHIVIVPQLPDESGEVAAVWAQVETAGVAAEIPPPRRFGHRW